MSKVVYLDNASTTPCDSRVIKAMQPYWNEYFGNPSAVHEVGVQARDAVEEARAKVAKLLNAPTNNIMFTSGATASNNILLQGLLLKCRRLFGPVKEVNIISTNIEHSSVLKCLQEMRYRDEMNHKTLYLKADGKGNIDLDELDNLLEKTLDVLVVSVMAANNEIGTLYNIEKIGDICKKHNVFFHTDATQAIGKIDIDLERLNIDALSMSSHKIYGPKGVGTLYMRNHNKILPLINGGYQEKVTSGTINVPAVVGFGEACDILNNDEFKNEEINHYKTLRNRLLNNLTSELDDIYINGTMENRLPNNLNLTITDVQAEVLVKGMDDVIVSTGSACLSGDPEPSHVLKAIKAEDADCAIRFTVGRFNTEQDIDYASARIIETVKAIRSGNG